MRWSSPLDQPPRELPRTASPSRSAGRYASPGRAVRPSFNRSLSPPRLRRSSSPTGLPRQQNSSSEALGLAPRAKPSVASLAPLKRDYARPWLANVKQKPEIRKVNSVGSSSGALGVRMPVVRPKPPEEQKAVEQTASSRASPRRIRGGGGGGISFQDPFLDSQSSPRQSPRPRPPALSSDADEQSQAPSQEEVSRPSLETPREAAARRRLEIADREMERLREVTEQTAAENRNRRAQSPRPSYNSEFDSSICIGDPSLPHEIPQRREASFAVYWAGSAYSSDSVARSVSPPRRQDGFSRKAFQADSGQLSPRYADRLPSPTDPSPTEAAHQPFLAWNVKEEGENPREAARRRKFEAADRDTEQLKAKQADSFREMQESRSRSFKSPFAVTKPSSPSLEEYFPPRGETFTQEEIDAGLVSRKLHARRHPIVQDQGSPQGFASANGYSFGEYHARAQSPSEGARLAGQRNPEVYEDDFPEQNLRAQSPVGPARCDGYEDGFSEQKARAPSPPGQARRAAPRNSERYENGFREQNLRAQSPSSPAQRAARRNPDSFEIDFEQKMRAQSPSGPARRAALRNADKHEDGVSEQKVRGQSPSAPARRAALKTTSRLDDGFSEQRSPQSPSGAPRRVAFMPDVFDDSKHATSSPVSSPSSATRRVAFRQPEDDLSMRQQRQMSPSRGLQPDLRRSMPAWHSAGSFPEAVQAGKDVAHEDESYGHEASHVWPPAFANPEVGSHVEEHGDSNWEDQAELERHADGCSSDGDADNESIQSNLEQPPLGEELPAHSVLTPCKDSELGSESTFLSYERDDADFRESHLQPPPGWALEADDVNL